MSLCVSIISKYHCICFHVSFMTRSMQHVRFSWVFTWFDQNMHCKDQQFENCGRVCRFLFANLKCQWHLHNHSVIAFLSNYITLDMVSIWFKLDRWSCGAVTENNLRTSLNSITKRTPTQFQPVSVGLFLDFHTPHGILSDRCCETLGLKIGQPFYSPSKSVNSTLSSTLWHHWGEMFKGLMFIFMSTTSKKSSPEIKECLIGLEGGNVRGLNVAIRYPKWGKISRFPEMGIPQMNVW